VLKNGERIIDELALANAHPQGAKPFGRADYIRKFELLTEGIITPKESARFLETVQNLPRLAAGELVGLNVSVPGSKLQEGKPGIF
jgi:2-methylcitrate dehydratase